MTPFAEMVAAGSTTNFIFLIVLGVLNYFRKRLNKSNCQSHCYIFDCEAQIAELQTVKEQITTQRGMLQNVVDMLDKKSSSKSNSRGPERV